MHIIDTTWILKLDNMRSMVPTLCQIKCMENFCAAFTNTLEIKPTTLLARFLVIIVTPESEIKPHRPTHIRSAAVMTYNYDCGHLFTGENVLSNIKRNSTIG